MLKKTLIGADYGDLAPRCLKRLFETIASSSKQELHHRDLWKVNNDEARLHVILAIDWEGIEKFKSSMQ